MDTAKTIYLKDYKKPDYLVDRIDLTFKIFEDKTVVKAVTCFRRNREEESPLILNGEHFVKICSVKLEGKEVPYQFDGSILTLEKVPELFTLEVETETDPTSNTRLEGLYKSGGNWCTQCEAEGFRTITCFPDRPDVMSIFTVRIEADKKTCPVLLSNGNLIEEGFLDSDRHFATWQDPFPKPCYLFALVAGDLVYIQDHFTTFSGRKVDLRIYVRKGDEKQCDWAMKSLIKAMKWDEEVYGREYQLDRFNIVAVSDFNMGAMENTSLNIFNTALVLAHPDTATDSDFERVESVIAHEYFHNWSGNRVTCRDWFQLSLKEGLTVFRDQEFSADINSRDVQRIQDVDCLRRSQFKEDAGPLSHPVRPDNYMKINNFYTVTVYEKGAEIIRMQRALLGPDLYRKATDLYFSRYDGMAVTCDDFLQCMEEVSHKDLSQFKLWYSQAGTPEVTAKGIYDGNEKTYTLDLSQKTPPTPGQPNKKPLHIPIRVGLVASNGEDIVEKLLELRKEKETFVFENIQSKPVPSILRGVSAPVKLKTTLSNEDLRFLMVHDKDLFNRWESGQTLALRMFEGMLDRNEEVWPEFLDSFEKLIQQGFLPEVDRALLACSLTLPDITVMGQQRDLIDPATIYQVYLKTLNALKDRFGTALKDVYLNNREDQFKQDFKARARRSLRHAILRILRDDSLAKEQYDSANCMTERVSALQVLADMEGEKKEEAFADFYIRFKDYQLVIDKWFSLQASGVSKETFARVKALKGHPDFSLKNPNRVRSLFSSFSIGNPVCFHDLSGQGYTLLAEAIKELDPINPQIAARLLTPFKEWRSYTPDRQEKMRSALESIKASKVLSTDVFEIVTKSLV